MYDTNSRSIIVNRMNEERLAAVRRDHILRAARDGGEAFEAKGRVASPGLRDALASAVAAVRHATARRTAHGGAGAR